MTADLFDQMAKRIFLHAIATNRCGELMQCLFEGCTATIDPTGQLILIAGELIEQAANQ